MGSHGSTGDPFLRSSQEHPLPPCTPLQLHSLSSKPQVRPQRRHITFLTKRQSLHLDAGVLLFSMCCFIFPNRKYTLWNVGNCRKKRVQESKFMHKSTAPCLGYSHIHLILQNWNHTILWPLWFIISLSTFSYHKLSLLEHFNDCQRFHSMASHNFLDSLLLMAQVFSPWTLYL